MTPLEDYELGYRNGRTDAFLEACSIIALTSPSSEYARGYRSGREDYLRERAERVARWQAIHEARHKEV